jgi:pimeloyl-ACP methyl ester carboxylesterase
MRYSSGTVALVVLSLLEPGCRGGAAPPAVGPVTTEGTAAVGGLSLYVHCAGQGAPLVVLEAGLGSDGRVWDQVEPAIGRFTHVCDYDRAGLGRSGPAPRPHTNQQMARELRTLLEQVGLAGP